MCLWIILVLLLIGKDICENNRLKFWLKSLMGRDNLEVQPHERTLLTHCVGVYGAHSACTATLLLHNIFSYQRTEAPSN